MAKKISQQGKAEEERLTRSERVRQQQALLRAEQQQFQASPTEQQKREVSQKIQQLEQQQAQLEAERVERVNRVDDYNARRQINEYYQKRREDIKSRITALNKLRTSLNKGYYFEEGYIDDYVESYAGQSAQARERSIRQAERLREAREEQRKAEALQKELSEKKIEDIQIVEESKDGRIIGKKYYAIADGKYYEIEKPTEYLKNLEQAKQEYNKQVESALKTKKAELEKKPYVLPEYVAVTRQPRRETIQDTPQIEFVPKSDVPSFSQFVIGGAVKIAEKTFSFVPDEPLVLKMPKQVYGIPVGIPTISTKSVSPEDIPLSVLKEGALTSIRETKQGLIEADIERRGINAELEPKYQELYQVSFERKYFEPIIKGEITFEEAKTRFTESDVAKTIGINYAREIDIKRAEGSAFTPTAIKLAGLGFAEGLTELAVPTTTRELVVKGAVVTGTTVALKKVPYLAPAVETGFVIKGTSEFLSPTKLPEERFTGLVTAGISGAFLGARVIRYARTPVIKTAKITVEPRLTRLQKTAKTFPTKTPRGFEREVIKDVFGKTTQKDFFKFSKLDEQIISGRRTIVSTKIRGALGFKPIYEGVPYIDKTGYTKALKVLTSRTSLTTAQAKELLKFRQPQAIIYETKGITAFVQAEKFKEPQLFTKGYRITTPESRIVNKALGIKTRGGVPTKEFFTARGVELATKGDVALYRSIIKSQKTFLTPEGFAYSKLSQAGKTTKTFEQLTAVKTAKTFEIGDKISAQLLKEQSVIKQLIPKLRQTFQQRGDILAFGKKQPDTLIVDTRELTGISAKEVPIRKPQPIKDIATYTTKDTQRLLQSLEKVYGKPTTKRVSPAVPSAPTTQKIIQQATTLRTIQAPPIAKVQQKLATITKIAPATATAVGTASVTALASASETALRQRARLNEKLAEVQKLDLRLDTALKQEPRLKQALRTPTTLRTIFAEPQVITPTLRTPTITTTTPLRTTPPLLYSGDAYLKRILAQRKKTGRKKELTFAPTFTEKAVGIEPIKIKPIDAEKLVKTEFTGFEGVLPVVRLT